MYDVNEHFVKPWTKGTGNSVALLMTQGSPLTASLMISHSWGESADEFVGCLEMMTSCRQLPLDTPIWFCLLANYQPGGDDGDSGPTVQQQLRLDPFRRVIKSLSAQGAAARGLVVVHTTKAEVYDRLWCVYEIDAAVEAGVEVHGVASAEYMLMGIRDMDSLGVNCQAARCTYSADEDMIRERVRLAGGFERLDARVAALRSAMVEDCYRWFTASAIYAAEAASAEESVQPLIARGWSSQTASTRRSSPTETVPSRVSPLSDGSQPVVRTRTYSSSSSTPQRLRTQTFSRADYSGARMKYPFFVVPIQRLLAMSRLESHEALLEAGDLVEWHETLGNVTFVSHPWLSTDHPDPDGVQLELLQVFLRRCIAGEQEVCPNLQATFYDQFQPLRAREMQAIMHDSYVWIDQCCVPQVRMVAQKQAIDSCPFYVMQSTMFVVLAPPAVHANGEERDIRAWGDRGWCRLELLANWMRHLRPPIVVESPSLCYIPSCSSTQLFNAEGHFVADGRFMVPADRDALRPIIRSLVEVARADAIAEDDLLRFRHITAMQERLIDGSTSEARECDVATSAASVASMQALLDWLAEMDFGDADEGADTGHTPLMLAVAAGRADLVRALLEQDARRLDAALRVPLPGYAKVSKGWTPLHLACWRMQPAVVAVLLDFGADALRACPAGVTPLHCAACRGDTASALAIVARAPGATQRLDRFGMNFMMAATANGQQAFAKRMLEACSGLIDLQATSALGIDAVFHAALDTGDPGTLATLLEAGCEVNSQVESSDMKAWYRCAAKFARCCYLTGPTDRGPMIDAMAHLKGSSAIHRAAATGNMAAMRTLLAHGADMELRNALGQTPLHYAAERGHAAMTRYLIDCGADVGARDRHGRDPSQVAERHGSPALAAQIIAVAAPAAGGVDKTAGPRRRSAWGLRSLLARAGGGLKA